MEVKDGKAANGSNIQQWGANGSAMHNTWKIVPDGNGYYYLYSKLGDGNSFVLDVTGKKAANGTNIELYSKNSSDAGKFKLSKNSDGTYSILTKVSGDKSCIEVESSSKSSGANVQEYTYSGAKNQKWKFTKVN